MTIKTGLDLTELAPRFRILDQLFVSLMKNRLNLATRVAAYKILHNDRIVRREVEVARLEKMCEQAVELGMDKNFMISLGYPIIGESCKVQIELYQAAAEAVKKFVEPTTDEELHEFYRANLLALTGLVAETYDEKYDSAHYATHDYIGYELENIESEVSSLTDLDTVLDLGCATGRMTLALASRFKKAIGYDLSPHMLQLARKKADEKGVVNVTYEEVDLEGPLPLPDASVSFVVMNMGTASDVRNLEGLMREVRRVLQRGGKFMFSFYNKEALVYAWDFLPWPVGLVAEINTTLHCLEVNIKGTLLSIYARPYTVEEIDGLIPHGMSATEVSTYPTISAILPHDMLHDNPLAKENVAELDKALASSNKGAYIVVTGVRN